MCTHFLPVLSCNDCLEKIEEIRQENAAKEDRYQQYQSPAILNKRSNERYMTCGNCENDLHSYDVRSVNHHVWKSSSDSEKFEVCLFLNGYISLEPGPGLVGHESCYDDPFITIDLETALSDCITNIEDAKDKADFLAMISRIKTEAECFDV